jgi:hypothetical protein
MMKKIINGLRYDSDSAIHLGSAEHGFVGDLEHWTAALYQTPRSKRFFIVGSGGAASRFSQSAGQNQWSGGSDLIPLTPDQALEWAETHLGPDTVELYFEVKDA